MSEARKSKLSEILGDETLGQFLRRIWPVVSAYWRGDQKARAWTLLVLTALTDLLLIGAGVWFSYWNADFFNALEAKDKAEAVFQIWKGFFVILCVLAATLSYTVALYHLKINWREWLTKQTLLAYTGDKVFHQMNMNSTGVDNPDQRIAMDVFNFTDVTPELTISLVSTVVRTITFSGVLWSISPALDLSFIGLDASVPGYLVYVAIIWAIFMTYLTHVLGRPLIRIYNEKEAREADFRYSAIRLREYSESIALSGGEHREAEYLNDRFARIRENWFEILKYYKRVIAFNSIQRQFVTMVPTFASLPAYLAGTMTLGVLMQARAAFASVEMGFAWFQFSYLRITQWKASVDRLLLLLHAFEVSREERNSSQIRTSVGNGDCVTFGPLTLNLPDGEAILQTGEITLRPNENVLISGQSGSGKTTLFRALSGLWTWGDGSVVLGSPKTLFLPQHLYLPVSSLKEVCTYPHPPEAYTDDEVLRLVRLCGLARFADSLYLEENWGQVLSGGERQRIGIVRAMLQRPAWLFIDEGTSALDPSMEKQVMDALTAELPETTVVSIAHRESLAEWHPRRLKVSGGALTELSAA